MHTWDPADYARHSARQEEWARDCVARLSLHGDQRVLDIGCGDGRMTAELAAHVPRGNVLGVDSAPEMIGHACAEHRVPAGTAPAYGETARPGLDFAVADAAHLPYEGGFDLVVSFNCLHWVDDQAAVLAGVARALEPGGRFFLHFAGRGNVASMRTVVEEVIAGDAWREYFRGFGFPFTFPAAEEYRELVVSAGLVAARVELVERDMRHPDGNALAGWLRTTWLPYLERVPEAQRERLVADIVDEYLRVEGVDDEGGIRVDAVRLEAEGRR